jgi:Fur family ferric uptake transcriptional regulator
LIYSAAVPTDPAALLRRRRIQITAQRLAVLRAVSRQPHVTADGVADAVRSEIGAISIQSVYDALALLAAEGLIRRIEPAGSPARFESRVGDNHHHLICRGCGRVDDVDCAVGSTPCLTALNDLGYEIDEAEVVYWGRCRQCRRGARKAPRAGTGQPPTAVPSRQRPRKIARSAASSK